jgi:hypothetical protein
VESIKDRVKGTPTTRGQGVRLDNPDLPVKML